MGKVVTLFIWLVCLCAKGSGSRECEPKKRNTDTCCLYKIKKSKKGNLYNGKHEFFEAYRKIVKCKKKALFDYIWWGWSKDVTCY